MAKICNILRTFFIADILKIQGSSGLSASMLTKWKKNIPHVLPGQRGYKTALVA